MNKSFLPPSDNLYKFVAISGILIMVYCFYEISNVSSRVFEVTVNADQLKYELDSVNLQMDALEVEDSLLYEEALYKYGFIIDSLKNDLISIHEFKRKGRNHLLKTRSRLRDERKESALLKISIKRFEKRRKDLEVELDYWKEKRGELEYWLKSSFIFVFIGFILWYLNLQMKLDKITHYEELIKKEELESLLKQNSACVVTSEKSGNEEKNEDGLTEKEQEESEN